MGSQRVGHNVATEAQQQLKIMTLTLFLKVQIQGSVLGHEVDRAGWRNEDKCFIYSSGNSGD